MRKGLNDVDDGRKQVKKRTGISLLTVGHHSRRLDSKLQALSVFSCRSLFRTRNELLRCGGNQRTVRSSWVAFVASFLRSNVIDYLLLVRCPDG